ncbi:MAG: hypothetical protein AAGN35_28155 [Bacteroidota bacterium]
MRKIILLFAVLLLCSDLFSQQEKNAVKIGLLRTGQGAMPMAVSYERSCGERVSVQPTFAFGYRRYGVFTTGNVGRRYVFHAGIEGRFYPLMRRGYLMSGLYAGPFASYDRQLFFDPEFPHPLVKQYWSSVGLTLGYQHSFFRDRLRIDGGIKWGYRESISRKVFDTDGGLLYFTPLNFEFSQYAYLQIGITF